MKLKRKKLPKFLLIICNGSMNTEDVLLINPADAARHFIEEGDMVCVTSQRGKVDIKAHITDQVRPGVLSTTFHFPEMTLNVITSDERDSEAMCPEYKVVAANIRKSKGKYKMTPATSQIAG